MECFGAERDGPACALMCYTVPITGLVRLPRDPWALPSWPSGDPGARVPCVAFCHRGESIAFRIGYSVGTFEAYCIRVLTTFPANTTWVNLNMFCLLGNALRARKLVIGFIVS